MQKEKKRSGKKKSRGRGEEVREVEKLRSCGGDRMFEELGEFGKFGALWLVEDKERNCSFQLQFPHNPIVPSQLVRDGYTGKKTIHCL
jgi:hypothetical protein